MRRVISPAAPACLRSLGFTLIELLVTVAVAALIALATLPALADAIVNARLRAAAQTLLSAAQFARSEAVKANQSMVLAVQPDLTVRVSSVDPVTARQTVVRSATLPDGVTVAGASVTYDSTGRPTPFGTDTLIPLAGAQGACGGDVRCPSVHLEAGGTAVTCFAGGC